MKSVCGKASLLSAFRKVFYKWKRFQFAKKAAFSVYARQCKNEKLFINPLRQHFSTAPKLTEVSKFHPRNPTVSLQQNIPYSKVSNLASDVQLPFRTDSNPHRRYPETLWFSTRPVTWWWPVTSAKTMYRAEIWIVPGVQRFANLWGTFGSFRTSEKNKTVPLPGTFEVFQTSKQLTAMAVSHEQN